MSDTATIPATELEAPSIRDLGRKTRRPRRKKPRPTPRPRSWRTPLLLLAALALGLAGFQACTTCQSGPGTPDAPPPDAAPPDSWPVSRRAAPRRESRPPNISHSPDAGTETSRRSASFAGSWRPPKGRAKAPKTPPPESIACRLPGNFILGLQTITSGTTAVAELFTFVNPVRVCGRTFAILVERSERGLLVNGATLAGIDVCADFSRTILELSTADGRFRHHNGQQAAALYFPEPTALRVCTPSTPMSKLSSRMRRPRQPSSRSTRTGSGASPIPWPTTAPTTDEVEPPSSWPAPIRSPFDSSNERPAWP